MCAKRALVTGLLVSGMATASAQEEYRAADGDYAVTMGAAGLVVEHKGEPITLGSYFTVFKPEYEGSVLSFGQAWQEGAAAVSEDGHTVTLEAALPQGSVSYSAEFSERGLRVSARVAVAEGVEVGPVEYAAFQIRPELVESATIEVWDVAGSVIDRQPVPVEPRRGGFARS